MHDDTPMRLDLAMVARRLTTSRSRARDLIRRGEVRVAGGVVTRPGVLVAPAVEIVLAEGAGAHVSRGAEKLAAALEAFGFEAQGRVALDVGASTGGFTEILLDAGAASVFAVDVGRGQLHPRLAADPRVVSLEGVDARDLTPALIPEPVGAFAADVSFISLTQALPAPLALAAPGAWLVALIKPQFEAGRAAVGKGGIVRDAAAREAAVSRVRDWLGAQLGWHIVGVIPSPIRGGSGNEEFLLGARRDG